MHRIYDEQNIIILDEELTKNWTILEDIYDILNVILIKYQDIRKIGISMPDKLIMAVFSYFWKILIVSVLEPGIIAFSC